MEVAMEIEHSTLSGLREHYGDGGIEAIFLAEVSSQPKLILTSLLPALTGPLYGGCLVRNASWNKAPAVG